MNVFASWSGGKESALATYKVISQGYQVSYLVNFVSEDGERSRSHGVLSNVLHLQAKGVGIPIVQVKTSWEGYEKNFKKVVAGLKEKGVKGGVFGDMDLEEHREWVERVCAELQIEPLLPLWKMEPEKLLTEFWDSGFKAIVVATRLDDSLLGRNLDGAFVEEIKRLGSHPCGESGEYHTLVTNGPIFQRPLEVTTGGRYKRDNVWFLEISAELGGVNSSMDV